MKFKSNYVPVLSALFFILFFIICNYGLFAQAVSSPPPRSEGEGPFDKKNLIASIQGAGVPGMPIKPAPKAKEGQKVMDLRGMYILPGFVDMHEHIGSTKGIPAEYVYKLFMGHGITTIREVGTRNSLMRSQRPGYLLTM